MNKYFLSDEQLQIRDAVRRFAAERITPQARRIDESDEFPRALFDELAAQGWLGARVASEFGGGGCDAVTACLILEEVSRASGSVGNSMNAHLSLVSTLIADHGSDAQKA
ncbi:MAG: acyl-CoA dehydrogenase family protein, partial [Rubrivivax sp.]|nr:acyl-CoA dehydrogenase family protein [Rubrivivax sp.]